MVGTSPPPGLCSSSPERRRSADVKTIRELRISVTKQDERGWMSENYPSLQPREKCFLLTSPFIEPDLMRPRTTQQSCSAALRRESQIEPWLANRHRQACAASAPNDIVARRENHQ